MALNELMVQPGPDVYYDPAFRAVLEDHLSYLRALSSTQQLSVSPGEAYRFEFDLNGLLAKYGVPPYLHWVTMRVNGYTAPEEFTRDAVRVLVPSQKVIDQIRQSHQTSRRIT